jgi:hypothetical protein
MHFCGYLVLERMLRWMDTMEPLVYLSLIVIFYLPIYLSIYLLYLSIYLSAHPTISLDPIDALGR